MINQKQKEKINVRKVISLLLIALLWVLIIIVTGLCFYPLDRPGIAVTNLKVADIRFDDRTVRVKYNLSVILTNRNPWNLLIENLKFTLTSSQMVLGDSDVEKVINLNKRTKKELKVNFEEVFRSDELDNSDLRAFFNSCSLGELVLFDVKADYLIRWLKFRTKNDFSFTTKNVMCNVESLRKTRLLYQERSKTLDDMIEEKYKLKIKK